MCEVSRPSALRGGASNTAAQRSALDRRRIAVRSGRFSASQRNRKRTENRGPFLVTQCARAGAPGWSPSSPGLFPAGLMQQTMVKWQKF
ncbi:hypothetical protein SRHO_G00083030 [Serrasalmus rhombeus]